ncbi:MAG: YqgE/AlgH family protein [Euzebyales bacterium]|nr:YqgE/AlgH family protein [Euzebyales bacterium]
MTPGLRGGRLLVATPSLVDPNFAHTVILLLEHGDEGAVGLVVNRPSEVALSTALPQWRGTAVHPPVVFLGGPVQRDAVIALGRVDGPVAGAQPILAGVAVVDLSEFAAGEADVRVFAGYAGWGAGQLEDEVASGGWFVVDARPPDPFSAQPEGLWAGVLQRQGGLFATVSPDPTMN